VLREKHGDELQTFWRNFLGHGLERLTDVEGHGLGREPRLSPSASWLKPQSKRVAAASTRWSSLKVTSTPSARVKSIASKMAKSAAGSVLSQARRSSAAGDTKHGLSIGAMTEVGSLFA
jgi:hypothetical protein